MAALKQQADKEHAEFEKEWTELGRLIENDKKMKEFMRQRHRQQDNEQRGDLSAEQEDKMKKKVTASAWGIAKDKATINSHIDKIQSYEEAFAKIQAATGISDVDELVQNFIDGEDQNFTVFNFTTGQNDEIEKLEQQIQEYKTELEQLRSAGVKSEDAQSKQKVMASLEEKWNNLDKKAEHYELKYQQTIKTVTSVRAGVQSIFNRLGCIPPEGGGSGTVTESNTMQYLGLIEQRTNEIKQLYATLKEEDDEEDEIMPPRGNVSSQLQIKLPSTVEDYDDEEDDDDEDDQRPFTREELKMKTMRGITKKQEKKGARRAK